MASWLRTRRFSEPTFRPSGAPNHWKNRVNRDFPTFSCICIFFLLTLSLLTLLTSAFQLSILSEVSLLNFLRLVLYSFVSLSPCSSTSPSLPFVPLLLLVLERSFCFQEFLLPAGKLRNRHNPSESIRNKTQSELNPAASGKKMCLRSSRIDTT